MDKIKRTESSNVYCEMLCEEPLGFRFGSDVSIYTERLIDGILVCADYRDNGIPVVRADEAKTGASFDLIVDGDSLYYGWEFVDFHAEILENGSVRTVLTLKNNRKDITLDVITAAGGFGFFTRSLKITNNCTNPVSITSVTPLKGYLFQMKKKSERFTDECQYCSVLSRVFQVGRICNRGRFYIFRYSIQCSG